MLILLSEGISYYFSGERSNVTVSDTVSMDTISSTILNDFNATAARWELLVQSNAKFNSKDQAYFAGYAEGYTTADLINQHLLNVKYDLYNDSQAPWLKIYEDYAATNMQYIKDQVEKEVKSQWWQGIDLVANHWLVGIAAGVKVKYPNITIVDMFLMNSQGDLEDIEGLYEETKEKFNNRIEKGEQHHCSAIVKHSEELDDVWFSQDTWTSFYSGFIRIAKTYKFNWQLQFTTQQNVTFSSMPGYFFSMDDFYVIKNKNGSSTSNLAVLETTYHTFNEELFSAMDKYGNQSTLTWMRCQLSNLQSMTPQQWSQYFTTQPSYTYNNNYLFLDYKEVNRVKNNANNYQERIQLIENNQISLLYTLEVVPTMPMFWDATKEFLSKTFYISINVPTNETLLELSGYNAKNDDYWSYNRSSRYCIFNRDLPNIKTYSEFKQIVRYNDYLHDPCSNMDPGQAISSRYDLRNEQVLNRAPSLFGATDSKTVSLFQAQNLVFDFIVGPISEGKSNIPSFNFSEQDRNQPFGYFNVFPNVWKETLSYSCLDGSSCIHGECQTGSCICNGFFTGQYCDFCPNNFNSECTHCSHGFKLVDNACVVSQNDLFIGLAIGIPAGALILGFLVWFLVWYSQKRRDKKDDERALLLEDGSEVISKSDEVKETLE